MYKNRCILCGLGVPLTPKVFLPVTNVRPDGTKEQLMWEMSVATYEKLNAALPDDDFPSHTKLVVKIDE